MSTLVDRYRKADRGVRVVMIAVAAVLVMTIAELVTGTSDLTSRSTASAALRLAIPILLAGLGGLYPERSGVVNIGLEGMMISGTWFAAWGAWMFGPWEKSSSACGWRRFRPAPRLGHLSFNVDHIVSGVAINILALGADAIPVLHRLHPRDRGLGHRVAPDRRSPQHRLAILAGGQLFGWTARISSDGWRTWSSSSSPTLPGYSEDSPADQLAHFVGTRPGTDHAWLLWKTPWGLRLRSCGEDPWAAESLGVRVLRMKYYGVIISGMLSGLAGAFLVLVQAGIYREGMTGGRGFIGLGALIFGNWMPVGVLGGSLVFGFGDSLRFRGPEAVRSFILAVAIGLSPMALTPLFARDCALPSSRS